MDFDELEDELIHIKTIVSSTSSVKHLKSLYLGSLNLVEKIGPKLKLDLEGLSYYSQQQAELDEIMKELYIENKELIQEYQTPGYKLLSFTMINISKLHYHNKATKLQVDSKLNEKINQNDEYNDL